MGGYYFSTGIRTPPPDCQQNFPPQIAISFSQPVFQAKVQIQNGLNEPATFTATSNNGTVIKLNVQGAGNEFA